jgi:hypothetical protein
MKREIVRVELLSTYLEDWKAPTSAVTREFALAKDEVPVMLLSVGRSFPELTAEASAPPK